MTNKEFRISRIVRKELEIGDSLLLTLQEHKLIGSSPQNERNESNPYTPLAILDNKVSVEDCYVARKRMAILTGCYPQFWSKDGYKGKAILTDINLDFESETYGQTLEDPVLLNADYFPDCPSEIDARERFPYKKEK